VSESSRSARDKRSGGGGGVIATGEATSWKYAKPKRVPGKKGTTDSLRGNKRGTGGRGGESKELRHYLRMLPKAKEREAMDRGNRLDP